MNAVRAVAAADRPGLRAAEPGLPEPSWPPPAAAPAGMKRANFHSKRSDARRRRRGARDRPGRSGRRPAPVSAVRGLAAALLVAAAPAAGLAQSARAFLSQNPVPLNGRFVLNVEVSGGSRESDPAPPDLSAFAAYLGSGTSTSVQIVNGRMSTTSTIQYRFQATREGTFEIGPVAVPVDGREVRTDPLTIEIGGAPAAGARGADGGVDADDLFVIAAANAERVYVNQPVLAEYRIYTRVDVEGYTVTPPGAAGFWVEELAARQGPTEQVVRDGVQYASTLVHRAALFPTSAGPKRVDPLVLEAQVRVQRRRGAGPFGTFGDSLFGRRTPVSVASNALDVDVLPVPPGAPASFSGFVGSLAVSAGLDRTAAETNDALTLRVDISGDGNVRTLPEPSLNLPPGVEVYPPEMREDVEPAADGVRGRRVYEYVIVPREPGPMTIPPIEFAYLDADRGAYAVASSDPLALTVAGDPGAAPVLPGRRAVGGTDPQRRDVRFIRIATPSFRPAGRSLFRSVGFWSVVVLPLAALAGAVVVRRHRDRLAGDVAWARSRRASRVARRRLARAEALCAPDRHREFHAEVGRAMQGFLGDKLNVAGAGLIREDVRAALAACGVADALVDACLDCLERCDRQRFAPTEPDTAAMQAMLAEAGRAMADLDAALSAPKAP